MEGHEGFGDILLAPGTTDLEYFGGIIYCVP